MRRHIKQKFKLKILIIINYKINKNKKIMDENTKKIIKEKFDALPNSIQELILSSHYQDTLIEIGKKYQLNIEQMSILERETTLVLFGLSPTKDFEGELMRELNIDKIKGNQITAEINEKIFLAIRDLLKLMYTPEGEEPSVEETPEENNLDNNFESREELLKKIENPESIKPIINYKLQMNQKELPAGDESELKTTTSEENKTHPILAQKLGGSFKMEPVETDHSMENISKSGHTHYAKADTDKPTIDPYREIPQ